MTIHARQPFFVLHLRFRLVIIVVGLSFLRVSVCQLVLVNLGLYLHCLVIWDDEEHIGAHPLYRFPFCIPPLFIFNSYICRLAVSSPWIRHRQHVYRYFSSPEPLPSFAHRTYSVEFARRPCLLRHPGFVFTLRRSPTVSVCVVIDPDKSNRVMATPCLVSYDT
ncbi:hypothetical protein C8R42DRAFT_654046 [Lentinula raphanica]|nr:hypothetical protein C8R42DRAFT_654046 [Lentinula raphanica]